jgi:hypothetical protein
MGGMGLQQLTVAPVEARLQAQRIEEPPAEDEIAIAYATGRITLAEHERRMAYYVDERNEHIEQLVMPIPGIDNAIGRGLAEKWT